MEHVDTFKCKHQAVNAGLFLTGLQPQYQFRIMKLNNGTFELYREAREPDGSFIYGAMFAFAVTTFAFGFLI